MKRNILLLTAIICIFMIPVCATEIQREAVSHTVETIEHGRLYWWPVIGLAAAGGGVLAAGFLLRRKHSEKEDR